MYEEVQKHNNCNANDSSWLAARPRLVAGCGRHHRRRHIEDVCSLANAHSKSVLVLFTFHTRVQPSRYSVPLSDGRTESEGGEARGSANAVVEGGNTCKKKETMQNYPHALINRKRRHPGIVLAGKMKQKKRKFKNKQLQKFK